MNAKPTETNHDQTEAASNEESLIDFPCQLTVRVMGANCVAFQQTVVDIVKQHTPQFCTEQNVKMHTRNTGKYISMK